MLAEATAALNWSCQGHAQQASTLWHQHPCLESKKQCETALLKLPDARGLDQAPPGAAEKAQQGLAKMATPNVLIL